MSAPADVRPPMLYVRTEWTDGYRIDGYSNPERNWPPCRVYWGSHGCARPEGHEGPHWCDCCECEDHARDHAAEGCVAGPPYYGPDTRFYGEGVPGWS